MNRVFLKNVVIIILLLMFGGVIAAQDNNLNTISPEQKLYEFSVIYRELYYNFANMDNCHGIDIDSLYREYIPVIARTKDDYDYFRTAHRFLCMFGNGHTYCIPPDYATQNSSRPMFTTKRVGKKVVVDKVCKIYGGKIKSGDEILTINGMTPDEYREKMLLPYTFASNIEAKKEMAQIGFRGDCFSFKHENKQLSMTVKRKNIEEKVSVPFISFSDYPTDSEQYRQIYDFYNTVYAASADAFATDKKNDFAYIKLAACYEQFDKFFFENYDNIVKYKNLIVDLSDNRGGGGQYTYNVLSALVDRDTIQSTRSTTKINNSAKKAKASSRIYYWNDSTVSREEKDMFYPFFYNNAFEAIDWLPEYYVNEIPDSLRYKGNIYLIVNGVTVSAAESFVAMLAQNPKVKILGRQTNGALGQPLVNELPSGMKFYIDTYKTLDTKGIDISKGIKPDYYCDFSDICLTPNPKERLRRYIEVVKQQTGR